MKTKSFILMLSAVALLSLGGLVAKAEGTWQYGYTFNTAYSNYYHSKKTHSATVKNTNTGRQGYDEQNQGVWAKAVVGRNLIETASFYYNYW